MNREEAIRIASNRAAELRQDYIVLKHRGSDNYAVLPAGEEPPDCFQREATVSYTGALPVAVDLCTEGTVPKHLYRCKCQGWIEVSRQLEAVCLMSMIHGVKYTGPVFKYCPVCGSSLREI